MNYPETLDKIAKKRAQAIKIREMIMRIELTAVRDAADEVKKKELESILAELTDRITSLIFTYTGGDFQKIIDMYA